LSDLSWKKPNTLGNPEISKPPSVENKDSIVHLKTKFIETPTRGSLDLLSSTI
jgi:hypothetical protein